MKVTDFLLWGIVVHLVADWIFQNEWMSINKVNLKHPAGYVHAGIHFAALLAVFPVAVSAAIAIAHLLIDTRKPLEWWRKVYRQTTDGPAFISFAMWQDQVSHIACIALAALWMGCR